MSTASMDFQLKFLLLTTSEIKETSLFLSQIILFLLYFFLKTENALDFGLSICPLLTLYIY